MFCKNCGRQIPDGAVFCPGCGSKRSGGETHGDGRSGANMKDLPSYAKENDLNRSDFAIDTNRDKFSLSGDSGQKKFSLSSQNKFSLSDSGKNKFSLSDKSRKDEGDGIVRISSGKKPEPPPQEPTGFVNPLKDSGKTVFRSDPAPDGANGTPGGVHVNAEKTNEPIKTAPSFTVSSQKYTSGNPPGGPGNSAQPGVDPAEPTGFVNPLKDSDQNIQWGSDGDRNTKVGDYGEINSHMGFAIVMTVLGGCDCLSLVLGIIAIVFASKVSSHVQNGNFEDAKKCSDTALTLCWISLGIKILVFAGSMIMQFVAALAR